MRKYRAKKKEEPMLAKRPAAFQILPAAVAVDRFGHGRPAPKK
jgi:hypothetical protein